MRRFNLCCNNRRGHQDKPPGINFIKKLSAGIRKFLIKYTAKD